MATVTNILSTNNKAVVLQSQGGALSIATAAVATSVVIGNVTSTSGTTINVGSAGLTVSSLTAGVVQSSGAGLVSTIATGNYGVLISSATGVPSWLANGTTGQYLTATTSGTPTWGASTPGTITWVDQTATPVALLVNTGYSMDKTTLITGTLPSTAAFGSVIQISGYNTGLWTVAQNSGQTIHFGAISTTTGTGGSLSATSRYDCITMVCAVANTDWVVNNAVGQITYV